MTAVAANVGGVEALLAGRPGSWEAQHIRTIVGSTTGDDDIVLFNHRTEPVVVTVDPQELLYELGAGVAYQAAVDELDAASTGDHVTTVEIVAIETERAVIDELWQDDQQAVVVELTGAVLAAARALGVPSEVPVTVTVSADEPVSTVDTLPVRLLDDALDRLTVPGGGRSYRARAAERIATD